MVFLEIAGILIWWDFWDFWDSSLEVKFNVCVLPLGTSLMSNFSVQVSGGISGICGIFGILQF